MVQSLVLITVDCLRADHTSFLGYHRNTTPFLDTLAKTGVVFSNAIVGGAPTYYSFPAIMASRHPLALGRDVVGIAPGEVTMVSALRQLGYTTGAFLAGNPYLCARFGYDAGFQAFNDFLDSTVDAPSENGSDPNALSRRSRFNRYLSNACHNLGPIGQLYDEVYFQYCQAVSKRCDRSLDELRRFPSADVIVSQATAWLETVSSGPFFLWLHFMDPHFPYYPREEALHWLSVETDGNRGRYLNSYWNRSDIGANRLKRHRDDIVALYDAGIRWVDLQIGMLVSELRRQERWDDCVLAVTADHGEEFLEHGGRFHSPAKLTEELIHVPLLLHGLERDPEVKSEPFSLIDLAPTLFETMKIPVPATFRGRSVWGKAAESDCLNQPVVAESIATCANPFALAKRLGPRSLAIRDGAYKLVFNFESAREDLFNLQLDPRELHALPANAEKSVRRRLLEGGQKHIEDSIRGHSEFHRLDAKLRDIRLECEGSTSRISV